MFVFGLDDESGRVIMMIKQRLTDGWEYYRGTLGGIWEVWRRDQHTDDNLLPWEKINLPHCLNAYDAVDPDTPYYQGEAWYCNKIIVNNLYPGGRTLLHFEGVGQKTDIYVYTQKVGSHMGGYDEFTVDISEAIANPKLRELFPDVIPVAIRCDNSRDLETIPSDLSDFNLYGGIYRYLNLVYVPAISIGQVKINVENVSSETATVIVQAGIYNPEALTDLCNIQITVASPTGELVHTAEISVTTDTELKELFRFRIGHPDLWTPEKPALYRCTLRLNSPKGETVITERFGVRFFEFVPHGPFKLNGTRLLLRGTHRHEDHAGLGAAMTEELIRKEMKLIKEMGVNFVRLGHYQQSRIVLEQCDELGILVWEEIPWCRGGLGGPGYQKQALTMLEKMITQHYNHPSIIIWGLGNENDWPGDFEEFDQERIRDFMSRLNDLAHRLDPSRVTAIRRADFCKDIVDVYSPSIWAGWYRGIYREYEEYTKCEFERVARFIHVEWGADNLAGRHAENPFTGLGQIQTGCGADERQGDYLLTGGEARISRDGDWSETYFCELIDWHLKCQEKMDWLSGTAQWAFKDFSTPVRPDNPIPYMNIKGVVERDLNLKEAYYVFQSYWTTQPMVHILGHHVPVRWGETGELKTVKVYSNCESAELFLNGASCGIKKRDTQDFPAAGLRWQVSFQPGPNQLQVQARQNGVTVSDAISFDYQIEKWDEPARLKLSLEKESPDRVWLTVKVFDRHGFFCPDAKFFIRFGLTGDGRLIDNLGTVNGSRYRQLVNGRGKILINTRGGKSVASVAAAGLETVFIEVK